MRFLFSLLVSLISISVSAQNFYKIRGYVYDENNEPLSAVEIRVKNSGLGTTTNALGQYELKVESGLNRLVFSYIGYLPQTLDIVSEEDEVRNVWMKPDVSVMGEIEITRKKKDIAGFVIQKVIDHRDSLNALYTSMKADVYIKSVESNAEIEKRKNKKKDDDEPDQANFDRFEEDNLLSSDSTIPDLHLYEAHIIRHFQKPDKIKEERLAVKKLGDQRFLFYKSTTEGDFNLYENSLYFRTLGQNILVSPFNPNSSLAYKFRLSMVYRDSLGRKIYVIKVIPRKMGNALFKGELEIIDQEWVLKSADLEIPKTALILHDKFSFSIRYGDVNGIHFPVKQEFFWEVKSEGVKSEGKCIARYKNIVFDTIYGKKFFNSELSVTEQEAYEKDTSFWAKIRPEPLTEDEQKFVRYRDSLHMIRTSKHYLDSIDSLYNRITFLKLVWNGQGYINRDRKENVEFSPLISVLDPIAIGGWRVRYDLSYYRKFENRKSIFISPFLNYGFKNQDFKGSIYVNYLFNPLKISYISFTGGRYFDFVNPFAPLLTIIRRDNFFQKNFLGAEFNTEIVNGLYAGIDADFEARESLSDFKFAALGDSLYENNLPIDFKDHNSFITNIYVRFTPKQLYLREPNEKIVLGSKYPTFSLSWRQGWNKIFNSSIKYNFMEFDISQKFTAGIFGVSQYRINMGKFLDTTSLRVMDYKYQRAGDPVFFTPAMYTYQLLDTTFPTFNFFIEGHYVHQFNGFIINRVPLLKRTQIKTMAGGGFLYAPERNYVYTEQFFGVNRVVKIGKERLRVGIHYATAQSNQFGFRSMFKFSAEFYNRTKNTWSF